MPALNITSLNFSYPGSAAPVLRDVSLQIKSGERFGLFGPNGAGKTTLISIMCGLLHAPAGKALLFGEKPASKENRLRFGYVPQDLAFYPELSAKENLAYFGSLYSLSNTLIRERSDLLLETFGLQDAAKKLVKEYSGGMKRRLNLAIGILHEPDILFLDEPTVGVDVQSRNAIVAYLLALNKKGTTLVYTSHHLREAEELCDHVALMDHGRIICDDRLENLLSAHDEHGLESLFLKLTGHEYRD